MVTFIEFYTFVLAPMTWTHFKVTGEWKQSRKLYFSIINVKSRDAFLVVLRYYE